MKRRAFFGTTLAGLPVTRAFAESTKARTWDIPTTTLGRTGVKVQVLAQGGARMDLHPDIPSAAQYVRQVYSWACGTSTAHACTGTANPRRRTAWACRVSARTSS